MEPLLKRRVLPSELDDLLSDNTTEESGLGGDGAGREGSSLSNYIFVKFFDKMSLFLLVGSVPVFGHLNSLVKILFGIAREATLSLSESVNGHDSSVELLRSAKASQVRSLKHTILGGSSWVSTRCFKAMEFDLLGNFNVLNKTLSLIRLHSGGIKLNLEGVGGGTNDLGRMFQFINAVQTFNFREFNIITFLITVSLILVHSNNSRVSV